MFFILGLLRSTALYGIISVLTLMFVFGVDITTIHQIAFHPKSFLGWFNAIIYWSLIAYPIIRIFQLVYSKFMEPADDYLAEIPEKSEDDYLSVMPNYNSVFFALWADITNPFRGLVALNGISDIKDDMGNWHMPGVIQVILHFTWTISFWAFFTIGFYKQIVH